MPFISSETMTSFLPESYLPTAVSIPSHFKSERVSISCDKLSVEIDEFGLTSVLKLSTDTGPIIPFIDLSRYDAETRDWLWYDETGLTYRYIDGQLKSLYPSNYTNLTPGPTLQFDPVKISLYSLCEVYLYDERIVRRFIYKHAPLILTLDGAPFTDVSDYVRFKTSERLNRIELTNREFSYDFNGRIFTNQNLNGLDLTHLKLHYLSLGSNEVSVKCRLSTNYGAVSHTTPIVDNYVIKLKGQFLKG